MADKLNPGQVAEMLADECAENIVIGRVSGWQFVGLPTGSIEVTTPETGQRFRLTVEDVTD